MGYLLNKRKKIFIPAGGSVEIRVDFQSADDPDPRVWLQCSSCSDEMIENKKRAMMECPECGLEITKAELSDLAFMQVSAIKQEFDIKEGKKGKLWRFITWFARSKKLPAPKS